MTRAAHRNAAAGADHVPTAPTAAQRERLARARAVLVLTAEESKRLVARAEASDQACLYDTPARSGATSASGKTTRGTD